MSSWLNDFEVKGRVIYVKSTGAKLPLNLEIMHEALVWLPFFVVEKLKRLSRLPSKKPRLNIAFTPVIPRPWYMLWVSTHRADMKFVSDINQADVIFYFEDQTSATPPKLSKALHKKSFNFGCTDISKSRVGDVFEKIFGYALTVDPESYSGPIAVKSEINGVHDGYEAQAPVARTEGKVYQRLIDNTVNSKWAEDLRCPVIGGEIELIFVKRRSLSHRFANTNANVTLHSPDDLLSNEERRKIKQFAAAMGLDWGGMDVLRNKEDGKIYIVDVNKTDMGPPIALSLKDKNTATEILTKQFIKLIHSKIKRNP